MSGGTVRTSKGEDPGATRVDFRTAQAQGRSGLAPGIAWAKARRRGILRGSKIPTPSCDFHHDGRVEVSSHPQSRSMPGVASPRLRLYTRIVSRWKWVAWPGLSAGSQPALTRSLPATWLHGRTVPYLLWHCDAMPEGLQRNCKSNTLAREGGWCALPWLCVTLLPPDSGVRPRSLATATGATPDSRGSLNECCALPTVTVNQPCDSLDGPRGHRDRCGLLA